MVSINRNIFTATPNAPTTSATVTSSPEITSTSSVSTYSAVTYTASAPNTGDVDYSHIKEILKQSEAKVAAAKEDLDEAEERLEEARDSYEAYEDWVMGEYGAITNYWPEEVRNEVRQRFDYMQACRQSCDVAQAVYNNALKTHRELTQKLMSKINNNKSVPTPTDGPSSSINAPTGTSPVNNVGTSDAPTVAPSISSSTPTPTTGNVPNY